MNCLTLVSSGIVNGNIVISIDAYATTFNGASVRGGINGGGDNGLGNSGFCGTNPSDPSCFNSQTSDCSINPSDPSCPTIAIGKLCTPPNPTSASPRNSTSSSTTSSAGGDS